MANKKLTEQAQRNRHNVMLRTLGQEGMFSLEEIADWLSWYYKTRKRSEEPKQ